MVINGKVMHNDDAVDTHNILEDLRIEDEINSIQIEMSPTINFTKVSPNQEFRANRVSVGARSLKDHLP